MKKFTGKILETSDKKAVVLTSEGSFKEIKLPLPKKVGETIIFSTKDEINHKKMFTHFKPYAMVAALLIFVLAFTMFQPLFINPAVASVSLDMNSGLEMDINKNNEVIKIWAKNQQGKELLSSTQLEGLEVYEAVEQITSKAIEMGFMEKDDNNFIMATIIKDENENTTVDKNKIEQTIIRQMGAHHVNAYVVINEAGEFVKENALEHEMSVNQYMVWQKYQDNNISVSAEDIKEQELGQVIKMHERNSNMEQMFHGTWHINNEDNENDAEVINKNESRMKDMDSESQMHNYNNSGFEEITNSTSFKNDMHANNDIDMNNNEQHIYEEKHNNKMDDFTKMHK